MTDLADRFTLGVLEISPAASMIGAPFVAGAASTALAGKPVAGRAAAS